MKSSEDKIVDFNFFSELFGFEETMSNVENLIGVKDEKQGVTLHSLANDRTFRVGTFQTQRLKEFKPPQQRQQHNNNNKRSTFNMVIGSGPQTFHHHKIDVGALQADSANKGATFQVASNFNCLEFISNKDTAKKGITKYIYDQTQGPAASISAAPGTLYRNYFVQHGRNIGQLEHQINLLDEFPFTVTNGYLSLTESDIHDMGGNRDFQIGDVKVGLQKRVQVTSGEKRSGMIKLCNDPEQLINQVFCSALNLDGTAAKYREHPFVEYLARFILRASYQATILAAYENSQDSTVTTQGKYKLFLTLLGGGVFGNQYSWIVDAITECEEIIINSGLWICLVVYSVDILDKNTIKRLSDFVDKTGGNIEKVI